MRLRRDHVERIVRLAVIASLAACGTGGTSTAVETDDARIAEADHLVVIERSPPPTAPGVRPGAMEVRLYDVSDLARPIRNFPGEEVNLDPTGEAFYADDGSSGESRAPTAEGRDCTFPDTWRGVQSKRRPAGSMSAPRAPSPAPAGLLARGDDGEPIGAFPLERTDVHVEIAGWTAATHLTQTFTNPHEEVVEAVYVFPLPTSAAVHDFEMEIGGRRIVGVIRPRDEAERIYAAARSRGQTASLMSQERTNVFTQSVANIAPGDRVDVRITYFHQLEYDEGAYEYVFPMVVGPRYMPGARQPAARAVTDAGAVVGGGGGGTSPDTTQVPDASRISPPVLPESMRSGRDVGIDVSIDAGVRIGNVMSPSHDIRVQHDTPARATVSLAVRDAIPNKDFVLRWTIATDRAQPGFVAHRTDEHGGFFSAFLVPEIDPEDAEVTPREITFVIDSSGSMRGIPIETSKHLVTTALRRMRAYDRFNIIQFAGGTGSMADAPVEASPENVATGVAYLADLKGTGGTEMLAGVRAWLSQPRDPRYLRVVVFLTDGFVGNEEPIHALIRDEGQDARWFAFGIGSSVNRLLIEGIAELGHGAAEVVLPREQGAADAAAARLFRRFASPLLVDVTIDANGLPLTDVYPRRIPDLFAGEPIKVFGRFTGPARGELLFRGRIGSREVVIPVAVDLPENEPQHAGLASIWARTRIANLSRERLGAEGDARTGLSDRIRELALEFRLMSSETSLLAVDESRIVGDGSPLRVLMPVELPQDVSFEGAVGPRPGARAVRLESWGVTLAEAEDGTLYLLAVDEDGVAAKAGLRVGVYVTAVGGHAVRGVAHLETLLLQAASTQVDVAYRNEDETARATTLPAP